MAPSCSTSTISRPVAHLRAAGVNIKAGNVIDELAEPVYSRNTGHFKPSSFKSLANFSKEIFGAACPERSRGGNLFLISDKISLFTFHHLNSIMVSLHHHSVISGTLIISLIVVNFPSRFALLSPYFVLYSRSFSTLDIFSG
jgi:hypothetical protein